MCDGILLKIICGAILAFVTACSAVSTSRSASPVVAVSPLSSVRPQSSPFAAPSSAIRSIDFSNVSFPDYPDYTAGGKKHITLKPGEARPAFINYGDVTGDGIEEAILVLGVEVPRGTAVPHVVYVFTLVNEKPRVLWDFETGDRADGGLRQVYADSAQLVIELYGKNRVVGHQLYHASQDCCPVYFTRARYKWDGSRFRLLRQQVLPAADYTVSPTMPRYDKSP